MAIIEKRFKLPDLEPQQVWCCENGCGECELTEYRHPRMEEEDFQGNLLNAEYHYHQVSQCCEAEVFLWDNKLNDEVDFVETELKPICELYAHDVEFYGEEKAITLWQWRYANDLNNWQDCNKPLSFKADKVYRRKPS